MTTKRPLILLTCYRRYGELGLAVEGIWRAWRSGEFLWHPEVWVVWARPEVGHLWYFQDLVARGDVHRVIGRPALPGEADDQPTSYPESHNLRLGLETAAAAYGLSRGGEPGVYVIGQAADVLPRAGSYRLIDSRMNDGGHQAAVFHWPGPYPRGTWHTNFFAVGLDPRYWPPLAGPGDADVLERQWGLSLERQQPPGIFATGNHDDKHFVHEHRSELLPPWPLVPQTARQAISLRITGHESWANRTRAWCISLYRWLTKKGE